MHSQRSPLLVTHANLAPKLHYAVCVRVCVRVYVCGWVGGGGERERERVKNEAAADMIMPSQHLGTHV